MQEFYVRDMMCPRCVAHVKEALSVEGVKSVDVNLDTKKVSVESNLSLETLMSYVKKAGYEPTSFIIMSLKEVFYLWKISSFY